MAVSDKVVSLQTEKHLLEQLAYEEIRKHLSRQFVLDPVMFMRSHGKRPEDFNGQDLRSFYREAIHQGLQVRQTTPLGFKQKFNEGRFFTSLAV